MIESSTAPTPAPLNPAHDGGKESVSKESLKGWTIETRKDISGTSTSDSRRSSLKTSAFHEDDAIGDDDDIDFRYYNIDAAVLAWDQIGELSHEITSSLMAKQASVLCELFRRKTSALELEPPTKKRRLEVSPGTCHEMNESPSTAVVISDEETESHGGASIDEGLPDDLSSQVDRIGRMSKLVMEIEYCQHELRREMIAMSAEL